MSPGQHPYSALSGSLPLPQVNYVPVNPISSTPHPNTLHNSRDHSLPVPQRRNVGVIPRPQVQSPIIRSRRERLIQTPRYLADFDCT